MQADVFHTPSIARVRPISNGESAETINGNGHLSMNGAASGSARLIPAILRTIDVTLEQHLAAEITTSNGRSLLDMCRSLLFWSVVQLEQHHSLYTDRIAGTAALADEAEPNAAAHEPDAAFVAMATPEESEYAKLVSKTKIHYESAAWLKKLLAVERRFNGTLDPESVQPASTAYHGGRSVGRPSFADAARVIDEQALTQYLRSKFPEFPAIACSQVTILAGGMSKQTILFEMSGHPDLSGPAVIRLDPETSYSDFSVVDEDMLLNRLHAAGLVVPEPLWLEPASLALGAPFLVVKKIDGQPAVQLNLAEPEALKHFVKRLAERLVEIHAIRPDCAAAAQPVHALVLQQVAELRAFSLRRGVETSVGFETLFKWLENNIPQNTGYPATLVHGDYGFHNVMVKDGEIIAVLDWEFSHYGDPAEDVAYCLPFVQALGGGELFIEQYEKAGGQRFRQDQFTYFAIWQNVRNAVYSASAGRAFARARPVNIRLALSGCNLRPRFELEALDQLLQIAGGPA